MDEIFKFKLDISIQMVSIADLNAKVNERILSSQSEILKLKDNSQSFYQRICSVRKVIAILIIFELLVMSID